jgi:hypothetical protein
VLSRLLVLLLASALALVLSPGAHGQTSPPATATPQPPPPATTTPQPTPTALPSAADLVAGMERAQEGKGSVRWTERDTYTTPHASRELDTIHGDISWRDGLLRQLTTTRTTNLRKKPNPTHISTSTDLVAGGILATRTNKQPWDCSALDLSSGGSSGSGSSSTDLGTALLGNARFTETNLGAETLNGVPVWHLRETMAIPGVTPKGKPGVGDYYVTQADDTPLREIVSLTTTFVFPGEGSSYTRVKVIQHSTTNFTAYGETFHVRIPRACRGTPHTESTAGFTSIGPMGTILRAATVLT